MRELKPGQHVEPLFTPERFHEALGPIDGEIQQSESSSEDDQGSLVSRGHIRAIDVSGERVTGPTSRVSNTGGGDKSITPRGAAGPGGRGRGAQRGQGSR